MSQPAKPLHRLAWRDGVMRDGTRVVADEVPVAIVHDGTTYAVMMASPADLADFAIGFSLTEGIIETPKEVDDLELVETDLGWVVRLWLSERPRSALTTRRRHLTGPAGCGLCGVESLSEAVKPAKPVGPGRPLAPLALAQGFDALAARQPLGDLTRAAHAAAFLAPDGSVMVREDVGRHNALDKLIGALARAEIDATQGAILMTSRVSVELVQKAAMAGAPILAAISAPSTLAVKLADDAGITLVAVARADGFEVFSHPHRIQPEQEHARVA
ncbi:sulfurtransferase FdhD [Niveispirillum lacus]|uniref:Sulfur carrier protein FdhD n=1 Tax=Niveispirillum lacus TaxID=1981099 RepID=A0A255Z0P1_9PROT|nr:formate dehydrogenase accessory sulfurtransferase FdhD [Niveispirillum lacus]OYQ34240.1 sulfurtransferase FdhD [Niveispirillum lacus]